MGNLKLKAKKRNAEVARIARVIKAVNDCIALKLLEFAGNGEPKVFVYPELVQGKDKAYLTNFFRNLWIYYRLYSRKSYKETSNTFLSVYSKENTGSDRIMFTFSDRNGLKALSI